MKIKVSEDAKRIEALHGKTGGGVVAPQDDPIEETKALLRRYLGEDTPHDISNMAYNISKIWSKK